MLKFYKKFLETEPPTRLLVDWMRYIFFYLEWNIQLTRRILEYGIISKHKTVSRMLIHARQTQ